MTTQRRQIDVNIPRFNQGAVALLTAVAFVLQAWPLVAATAGLIALNRFAGLRFGVFTQIYLRGVRPRLREEPATEWADPPRFSQTLAVIFLTTATVLLAAGAGVVGWAITLMVTALATLASTARICVGCILYERFVGPAPA